LNILAVGFIGIAHSMVMSTMGHDPKWEVTLGLETKDGKVEQLQVLMTEENRNLVRE
jgi:hypothetical protein